jgi:hypothetical protein
VERAAALLELVAPAHATGATCDQHAIGPREAHRQHALRRAEQRRHVAERGRRGAARLQVPIQLRDPGVVERARREGGHAGSTAAHLLHERGLAPRVREQVRKRRGAAGHVTARAQRSQRPRRACAAREARRIDVLGDVGAGVTRAGVGTGDPRGRIIHARVGGCAHARGAGFCAGGQREESEREFRARRDGRSPGLRTHAPTERARPENGPRFPRAYGVAPVLPGASHPWRRPQSPLPTPWIRCLP